MYISQTKPIPNIPPSIMPKPIISVSAKTKEPINKNTIKNIGFFISFTS